MIHFVSIAEKCLSCVHRFIFTLIRYRFRDISTFIIGADIAAGHAAEVWMSVSSLLSLVSVFALHCTSGRAFRMINKERRKYNMTQQSAKYFYVFMFDIYAFTCIIDHFKFLKDSAASIKFQL